MGPRERQTLFLRAGLVAAGAAILAGLGLFLQAAFTGELTIHPVAFRSGSLEIRWYGIFIAVAVILGLSWALRRAPRIYKRSQLEALYWWGVLGGALGARTLYVLQNLPYFVDHPGEILAVADGGMSVHGMLLGGLVAGALAARSLKISFWQAADAAVPAILLGMVIGRFGNFTNYELFGGPTEVPWKMFVPVTARPEQFFDTSYFHPVFLYEALFNTCLLIFLLRTERTTRFSGELTFRFLAGIATTRFIVEFWRIGERVLGPFSSAQLASILIGAVALAFLWLGRQGKLAAPYRLGDPEI